MTKSSIISKSMKVLDIICASRARLTYSQITAAAGLPKSSTHRLLSILREEGLVAVDPLRNVYGPGPVLMGWATNVLSAYDLPDIAASALINLSREIKASAGLSILDGNKILWLKMIDFPRRHRHQPRVGDRTPLHVTAAGKVLLAFIMDELRQDILSSIDLEKYTHRTISDPEKLIKEISQVRAAGYAVSNREEFLHEVAIAAPVFDHNGDVIAAVSMWDITGQRSVKDLLAHRHKLIDTAAGISAQLGFSTVGQGDARLSGSRLADD
jgi:DNA-binding IclR family transcriptional regulator